MFSAITLRASATRARRFTQGSVDTVVADRQLGRRGARDPRRGRDALGQHRPEPGAQRGHRLALDQPDGTHAAAPRATVVALRKAGVAVAPTVTTRPTRPASARTAATLGGNLVANGNGSGHRARRRLPAWAPCTPAVGGAGLDRGLGAPSATSVRSAFTRTGLTPPRSTTSARSPPTARARPTARRSPSRRGRPTSRRTRSRSPRRRTATRSRGLRPGARRLAVLGRGRRRADLRLGPRRRRRVRRRHGRDPALTPVQIDALGFGDGPFNTISACASRTARPIDSTTVPLTVLNATPTATPAGRHDGRRGLVGDDRPRRTPATSAPTTARGCATSSTSTATAPPTAAARPTATR